MVVKSLNPYLQYSDINLNSYNTFIFKSSMFNTKPVALYTCNGPLELPLTIPAGTFETTRLFRIEDVKNCDTLTLRLLVNDGTTTECTGQTAVVSLSCICGLQCFDPINCDLTCNAAI